MPQMILVASDLHYSGEQAEVLTPFLRLLELAKRYQAPLFLNGDLFNFWFESKGKVPADCEPMLDNLKEAVDTGLCVTVLRGNRDFLMNDLFEKRTGVRLIREDVLQMDDLKVIITHGDQYDENFRYQTYRKAVRSKLIRKLIQWIPPTLLERLARRLRHKSLTRKSRPYSLPSSIACPDQFRLVLGHYHQEKIQENANNYIIFCPAFDVSPRVLKLTMNHFEFLEVM